MSCNSCRAARHGRTGARRWMSMKRGGVNCCEWINVCPRMEPQVRELLLTSMDMQFDSLLVSAFKKENMKDNSYVRLAYEASPVS